MIILLHKHQGKAFVTSKHARVGLRNPATQSLITSEIFCQETLTSQPEL